MKIIWAVTARIAWQGIVNSVFSEFGMKAAEQFVNDTKTVIRQIDAFPMSAPTEKHLKGAQYEYRSKLINKLTKIIYRVDGDEIHIDDIWEVRKLPDISFL